MKWQRSPVPLLESAGQRYGDVWTLRLIGGAKFVVISDPALVERVLTAEPTELYGENRLVTPLVGERSVLVLNEPDHGAMRELLAPAFRRDHVDVYRDLIAGICEDELAKWPLQQPLELLPRILNITLNVIMSAIFGVSNQARQDEVRSRVEALYEWVSNPVNLAMHQGAYMRGWRPPRAFRRRLAPLDQLLFEEIGRARDDPRRGERNDILALLVGAGGENGGLTDGELRDQLVTLLLQGHTSTANAIGWVLERVLRHPEVHERLRAESQTSSEEYLDAVVKETLRVRPPLPFPTRRVKEPFQLGDYQLQPETMLLCNGYMLHRRADLYPEPDRFRPERFLEQQPGRYTWIPFGGGFRACLGAAFALAEIKIVVRTLFQRVRLSAAAEGDEGIKRKGVGFAPAQEVRAVVLDRLPATEAADVPA